ncbi:MAG: hypothetical protein AAGL98_04505, partial [Planctomycetota bacterium]
MVETIDQNPEREADAKLRASGELRSRLVLLVLGSLGGGYVIGGLDTSRILNLVLAVGACGVLAAGAIWLSRLWIALP